MQNKLILSEEDLHALIKSAVEQKLETKVSSLEFNIDRFEEGHPGNSHAVYKLKDATVVLAGDNKWS